MRGEPRHAPAGNLEEPSPARATMNIPPPLRWRIARNIPCLGSPQIDCRPIQQH